MKNPHKEGIERLRDITADIGPMYPNNKATVPMYSFDRPAWILWQAVYDAMRAEGCSDEQAIAWLQGRGPRMELDGGLGDKVRVLGIEIGRACASTAKTY